MKLPSSRFKYILNQLGHLDPRIGVILLVALIFLIAGTASTNSTSPKPQSTTQTPLSQSKTHESQLTSSPIPGEITPESELTPSPLPPELIENGNQTIGLSIGATIIILIVLVGVLNALLRGSPGDR